MSRDPSWILYEHGVAGDLGAAVQLAVDLERRGQPGLAAVAWDRAWGLAPGDPNVTARRARLLDGLSVTRGGLRFRYVPAGTFEMGSDAGDPDEGPAHPVRLRAFWMAEVPLDWVTLCAAMGWRPPPEGTPRAQSDPWGTFYHHEANKIRRQYCGTSPDDSASDSGGAPGPRARSYSQKPVVAVAWQDLEPVCEALSDARLRVRLPSEAQWEKAARGGRIGAPYPWGAAAPDETRCDCERFGELSILPSRALPPNGYGLYSMSGGVREWTRDWYDARAYGDGALRVDPGGPPRGVERALRGGAWADCAEAATVTFRDSCGSRSVLEDTPGWGHHMSPCVGARLCLELRDPDDASPPPWP